MTMKGGYISAVRTDPVSKGQFGIALWDGADLTIEGGKIEPVGMQFQVTVITRHRILSLTLRVEN